MFRQAISIGLIIVAGLVVVGAQAQDKLALKSVNVDLPFGDRMFQGPGLEALNNNCLACHSVGMVLTQPALSKEQWHAEVEKMLTAYKAPIDPKDIDAIVNSLMGVQQAK
jgi:hypothetical protein